MQSEETLIEAYKSLWNGRSGVQKLNSIEMVKQAVLSELKDELSHPRARRRPDEKLKLANDRIDGSSLSIVDQSSLKVLYLQQFQQLSDVVNPNLDEI